MRPVTPRCKCKVEADGATPVAPVDAVDQQREPMMALLSAVGRRAVAVSRKNKRRAEDGLSHKGSYGALSSREDRLP
jgi:hypothetical protein